MKRSGRVVLLAALSVSLFGCGGKVGEVRGTVTLDGKPLPNALVTFQPENGGRPSIARTDESGQYELQQSEKVKGATVGSHRISVTVGGETDTEGKKSTIVTEKVPAKYNLKSELVREVRPGRNAIDLPLDSKGEIIGVGKEPPPRKTVCGGDIEPNPDEPTEPDATPVLDSN